MHLSDGSQTERTGSRLTTPAWDMREVTLPSLSTTRDDAMQSMPTSPRRPRRREVLSRGFDILGDLGGTVGSTSGNATREGSRGSSRHLVSQQGHYMLGRHLDQQLLPASAVLLQGLQRWPGDDSFRSGFEQVLESVKMTEAPERYLEWPFAPLPEPPPRIVQKGVAPGKLEAPFALSTAFDQAGIKWSGEVQDGYEVDPAGDFELSEFVILSSQSGVAVRYELEVADVDALFGVQAWRCVHRGEKSSGSSKLYGGIRRGVSAIRTRVRAGNRFGFSDWSDETQIEIPPIPEDDQVEIMEVPAAWIDLDLGGLPDFDERMDAGQLLRNKEALLKSLFDNRNVMKVAFTFYALAGVSDVEDDPSTMTMLQFCNFCMGAKVMDGEGLHNLSDLDLIFLRACRAPDDATQALASAVDSSGVAVGKGWRKKKGLGLFKMGITKVVAQKKGNLMTQTQFVGALLRLASQMYVEDIPIEKKLTLLCKQHVAGHVYDELQLVKDDFNSTMKTRHMGSVLDKNASGLQEVFVAYAAADAVGDGTAAGRQAAKAALETMNVRELAEMCEDIQIFDQAFTTMKLLAIFCKVNIDDDLFEQEDEANSSSELVFDEFEEVVARIFNMAIFQPMMEAGDTAKLLDQDGDGDLDDDDIDDLYDECDEDKSGSISVDELAQALRKRLNAGAAYLVAKKLVKIADTDGGGTLSKEELREAVHKLMSGEADDDDDGMELERVFHDWLGSVEV